MQLDNVSSRYVPELHSTEIILFRLAVSNCVNRIASEYLSEETGLRFN